MKNNAKKWAELGRQPDKTRYLKAARRMETPEIPFFETEVDFEHVKAILGRDIAPARSYLLSPPDYREFLELTGMDIAYVAVPWKFGRREVVDERGINNYAGGTVRDRKDLSNIEKPGMDGTRKRIEEMLEILDGSGIGLMYVLNNAHNKAVEAMGHEEYYISLVEKPGFVKELQKRVDEVFEEQEQVVLGYPVDAVRVGSVPCMKTGLMISMAMAEEFVLPFLKRSIERARAEGVIVSAHADGNQASLYPLYIEMGVDVMQAVEKCGGAQDVFSLKEKYGHDIAFHGTIDVEETLVEKSPGEIRDEVRKHRSQLGKGGGYVCASNHDISWNVPLENFRALVEAANESQERDISG